MHTGALISFKVAGKNNHIKINNFCRKIYGYTDKSNKGKYTYERKGLITRYPYIKIQRGLIIVRIDDAEEIINLLEKHGAEVFMREIILLHKDTEMLKNALNKIYVRKNSEIIHRLE